MGTLDFDLKGVVALAEEAGRATLTCYQKPLEIRYKGDESPVSQADELGPARSLKSVTLGYRHWELSSRFDWTGYPCYSAC